MKVVNGFGLEERDLRSDVIVSLCNLAVDLLGFAGELVGHYCNSLAML